jgi:hypothetical protein
MKIIHTKPRFVWQTGFVFILLITLILCRSGEVRAQPHNEQSEDTVFESINVDIWPEYDRPSVLIIYHARLSAQVSLPATIIFRIPAASGKPFAVAWKSEDNALYDLNYNSKPAGEWTEIQFSTPAPDIQIEYYDPGLKKTGIRREFTYRWPGNHTVQNLSLQIQQPINATNMKFVPGTGSGRTGNTGLVYYSLLVGQVSSGTTFNLALSYDKADDTLTNSQQFQTAQPNQPLDGGVSGRVALDQFLPWSVGGLGLMLIAAGLLWYWKTGRISNNRSALKHARHSRSEKRAPNAESNNEVTFCHQCGKKAAPGDVFCRACGTRLRWS